MKLVFPNGEHAQVLLSPGLNRIGSAADATVVLALPGISPLHCEIHVGATAASLVPAPGADVTVNSRVVRELIALRGGDALGLAGVTVRVVAVEAAHGVAAPKSEDDDSGATRVRMAVPKFILRGVSGPAFGKVFAVHSPVVIGRAVDCDIAIPADEISRRHVQLKPTPDGVAVEDLSSANGTYINGKRVQQGFLAPGDELRLDTVRFLLVVPGQEMGASQRNAPAPVVPEKKSGGAGLWLTIALVAAALTAAAWLLIGRV